MVRIHVNNFNNNFNIETLNMKSLYLPTAKKKKVVHILAGEYTEDWRIPVHLGSISSSSALHVDNAELKNTKLTRRVSKCIHFVSMCPLSPFHSTLKSRKKYTGKMTASLLIISRGNSQNFYCRKDRNYQGCGDPPQLLRTPPPQLFQCL